MILDTIRAVVVSLHRIAMASERCALALEAQNMNRAAMLETMASAEAKVKELCQANQYIVNQVNAHIAWHHEQLDDTTIRH